MFVPKWDPTITESDEDMKGSPHSEPPKSDQPVKPSELRRLVKVPTLSTSICMTRAED